MQHEAIKKIFVFYQVSLCKLGSVFKNTFGISLAQEVNRIFSTLQDAVECLLWFVVMLL